MKGVKMELWHPHGPGLKESQKTCEEAWIWTKTESLIDLSANSGGIRDRVLIAWRGMATHSRTLAWRIPWTEKPDGPQRVGCD